MSSDSKTASLTDGISVKMMPAVATAMPANMIPLATIHFFDFKSVITLLRFRSHSFDYGLYSFDNDFRALQLYVVLRIRNEPMFALG